MAKVRINQGRVMNGTFRFFATLIAICVTIVIVVQMNTLIGFLIVCLVAFLLIPIWTSFYLFEVDTENKTYSDVTVVLGKRYGEINPYSELMEIYLKPQKYKQNFHRYTGTVEEIGMIKYDSYLKIDNQNLFLLSDDSDDELQDRLVPVAKKLGIPIRLS